MSYDLTFVRVRSGEGPASALERYREADESASADLEAWIAQPLSDRAFIGMRRVAAILKGWRPNLEEFVPAKPLPWIELTDDVLGMQFSVREGAVDFTMPYFREQGEEMMECALEALELLQRDGDFAGYDPQLDRFVSREDLPLMLAVYEGTNAKLPEILAQGKGLGRPKARPWWKFW